MFDPIDLSFFADAVLDEVMSGEPRIDGTILLELARQAHGPILELGCGYGRITIPLAQHGVQDLTGLDLSAPSLAYARARADTLPIHWVEADVRDFHLSAITRAEQERLDVARVSNGAQQLNYLLLICSDTYGNLGTQST